MPGWMCAQTIWALPLLSRKPKYGKMKGVVLVGAGHSKLRPGQISSQHRTLWIRAMPSPAAVHAQTTANTCAAQFRPFVRKAKQQLGQHIFDLPFLTTRTECSLPAGASIVCRWQKGHGQQHQLVCS